MIAYTDLISACGPVLISNSNNNNNNNNNNNKNNKNNNNSNNNNENNIFKKYTDPNINLDLLYDPDKTIKNEVVIINDNSAKDKFIIELFDIISNFKFEDENNDEICVEEKENLENIQEKQNKTEQKVNKSSESE
ncbi:hypothetical protein BVG19_g5557 [[Candida] boidinii]|nr:hypothetical protein BVG19_g5557 [[Candida] boidinii]OWB53913.1 hypothetical protein B5S27_g5528 [[Candida] boidinii]